MKNVMLVLAGIMMISLIIATFLYQNHSKTIALPSSIVLEEQIQQEKTENPEQTLLAEDTIDYSLQNDELNITFDKGENWTQVPIEKDKLFADVYVPKKYEKIFVSAETPVKEADHLAVLLNQGPNGDYQGGEVKGKFISGDNGKTWEFSEEAKPNETNE